MRTWLITGCSTGIGRGIAKAVLDFGDQAISDYTTSVGSMRLENMVNNHDQKGDPDKAGKLIVELVSSGKLPKRLPLGSDAVRIIRDELKSRLAEVEETESYSVTTDY